jgi:integrase
VSSSTQNQAFNALLFLYREVLKETLDESINAVRVKKPTRLPTVTTKDETMRVIAAVSLEYQLMVKLIYGSGLRLMECVRLRVKDIDFGNHHILVRDGKGMKDRITVLPAKNLSKDPRTGETRRHYVHEGNLQNAVRLTDMGKPASVHSFRHGFATHLWRQTTISGPSRNSWATRTFRPR